MRPTIGRIVHYVDFVDGSHRAAVVAEITLSGLTLSVLRPDSGWLIQRSVNEGTVPGTWHWPELELANGSDHTQSAGENLSSDRG